MEEEDIAPFLLQPTEGRRLRFQASSIFLNSGAILLLLLATAFAFGFRAIWDSLNPVSFLLAVVCVFLGKNLGSGKENGGPASESRASASTPMHKRESLNLSDDEPPPFHPVDSDSDSDQFYDAKSDDEHQRSHGAGSNSDRARARSEQPQEVESYGERWLFHDDTSLNGNRAYSSGRFFDDTDFPGYRVNANPDHGRDVLSPATASERQQNVEIDNNHGQLYGDTHDDGSRIIGSNPDQMQIHPPAKQQKVKNNNKRRGFYDTYLDGYGMSSSSDQVEVVLFQPPSKQEEVKLENLELDVNGVFQQPIPSAPPLPESPPPSWWSPPAEVAIENASYEDCGHEKRTAKEVFEEKNFDAPPTSPQHPPLQPAPASRKSARWRAMDLLASLKKKKKKKKKQILRQNSVGKLASLFDPQSPLYQHSIPPPSATPDPPPSRSDGASTSREPGTTTEAKPPKPARSTAFSTAESNIESGNSSPLSSIPPSPPPPPPFGVIPWKFEWDGDFVRAASFTSSMCGSLDLDGAEPSGTKDGNSESTSAPSFCSSPDMNVKAGNFIASFRADLMMQNYKKARLNSRAGPYNQLGRKGPIKISL